MDRILAPAGAGVPVPSAFSLDSKTMDKMQASLPATPPVAEPTLAILATTALQVATATAYVVGCRGALIAQAAVDPWAADHVELGRMVPEKVAAFTSAATALALGVGSAHQAATAHATAMALAWGMWPTPYGMLDLLSRVGSYNAASMDRAVRTASEVLSPIHSTVMVNASRLAAPTP